MKPRLLVVLIALAVVLSLAGIVVAAPSIVSSFTVSPSAAPVGATVTFEGNYNVANTAMAFCFYFTAGDTNVWNGNFNALNSVAGVSFTEVPTTTAVCPAAFGYANFYFFTNDTNAAVFGDTFSASVIVPGISTGTKIIAVRQYSGTNCDGTAGNIPGVAGNCATLENFGSANLTVQSAPTTVYASNQATCGGYGVPGTSCFQSLSSAINALSTTGTEVVIVGELTANAGGSIVPNSGNGSALATIRGISSAQLTAPSGCSQSPLTIAKTSMVSVYSFIIDGTACSGQTGLSVTGNVAVSNLTVQNFSSGTGIAFSGTGTGSVKTSVISGNNTGIADTTSAAVSVGTGPADGNTVTDNSTGIVSNGGITIKGNTISGGAYGVELTANATAFYGNRITGASTQQVRCNGATAGAAWNYLGGTSPASGSNCPDVANQLGSNWVNWSDGGIVSGLNVGGSVVATFDLGSNLPFQYGDTTGRTSNYFAVYGASAGTVTVGGTGTTQYKMFVPPNTGGVCPTGTEHSCWESLTNSRTQSGAGYYYSGTLDPTAITLNDLNATTTATPWPLVIAAVLIVAGMSAWGLLLRRRAVKA